MINTLNDARDAVVNILLYLESIGQGKGHDITEIAASLFDALDDLQQPE